MLKNERYPKVEEEVPWGDLAARNPTVPHVAYCHYRSQYPNSLVKLSIIRRERLVPQMKAEGYDVSCLAAWDFTAWELPINPNDFHAVLADMVRQTRYKTAVDRDFFLVCYEPEYSLATPWSFIIDDLTKAAQDLSRIIDEALASTLLKCDLAIAIASSADDTLVHGLTSTLRRSVTPEGKVEVCFLPSMTVIRATATSGEGAPLLANVRDFLNDHDRGNAVPSINQIAVRSAGRYFSLKPIEFLGVEFDLQALLGDAKRIAARMIGRYLS